MPVFLSHKLEDTTQTIRIKTFLEGEGINCYVDTLDPATKSTDDLTKLIMDRVKACTHLMAVVSNYTTQSWWVPFEIGVGSELQRRITSYKLSTVDLPEFLKKWPILASTRDLESFVEFYRRDQTVTPLERKYRAATVQSSDQFHSELKGALRQFR